MPAGAAARKRAASSMRLAGFAAFSMKYVFCKKSAHCVSLDNAESGGAQLRCHYPISITAARGPRQSDFQGLY
jgi:hypothetical protein